MKNGGRTSEARAARSPHDELRLGDLLIGGSPLFRHVLAIADAVATNDCVVLLEGESGTGKELLARRIHFRSARRGCPFVPVNCASISDTLFESQFFGHIKGSFTGAVNETLGMVRAAQDGTLLLDEVGDIPYSQQPKLLRLLQEREVVPVGGTTPIPVNVRFIAATNRSLREMADRKEFRSDLYHRLNIVRIELPPLRCRHEDIEPLLDWYLQAYADEYGMTSRVLGAGIRRQLREYAWPGNVRELAGYVERLYAADLPPLPPEVVSGYDAATSGKPATEAAPGRITEIADTHSIVTLAQAEQAAILKALQHTSGNRSAAARLLEVHRSTLLRKMRFFNL